jgi:hypothetical protein
MTKLPKNEGPVPPAHQGVVGHVWIDGRCECGATKENRNA